MSCLKIVDALRESFAIIGVVDWLMKSFQCSQVCSWVIAVSCNFIRVACENGFIINDCANDPSQLYTKLLPTIAIQVVTRFATAMGQTPSQQMQELKEEISLLKQENQQLRKTIEEQTQKIEEQTQKIEEQTQKIEEQTETIAKQTEIIKELKQTIKELKAELNITNDAIAKLPAKIQKQINELKNQLRTDIKAEIAEQLHEYRIQIEDSLEQNRAVIKDALKTAFDGKIDDIANTVIDEIVKADNFEPGLLDSKYLNQLQQQSKIHRQDSSYRRMVDGVRKKLIKSESDSE